MARQARLLSKRSVRPLPPSDPALVNEELVRRADALNDVTMVKHTIERAKIRPPRRPGWRSLRPHEVRRGAHYHLLTPRRSERSKAPNRIPSTPHRFDRMTSPRKLRPGPAVKAKWTTARVTYPHRLKARYLPARHPMLLKLELASTQSPWQGPRPPPTDGVSPKVPSPIRHSSDTQPNEKHPAAAPAGSTPVHTARSSSRRRLPPSDPALVDEVRDFKRAIVKA